jgi:hypothetical protein
LKGDSSGFVVAAVGEAAEFDSNSPLLYSKKRQTATMNMYMRLFWNRDNRFHD